MNKDLIITYENEKMRLRREMDELWEVGKKSPKKLKRYTEIEFILEGLKADEIITDLRIKNLELKRRLQQEGIDLGE